MQPVDDLDGRTLRELLTLAHQRLGHRADGLKARDELLSALRGAASSPMESQPTVVPQPVVVSRPVVAPLPPAPGAPSDAVVTRDFFVRRA